MATPVSRISVFARGQHVVLYGAVEMRGSASLQITNPQYEILDEEDAETIHTGRVVPVYERSGTVTGKMQRRWARSFGCAATIRMRAKATGCRRTCAPASRTIPMSG